MTSPAPTLLRLHANRRPGPAARALARYVLEWWQPTHLTAEERQVVEDGMAVDLIHLWCGANVNQQDVVVRLRLAAENGGFPGFEIVQALTADPTAAPGVAWSPLGVAGPAG